MEHPNSWVGRAVKIGGIGTFNWGSCACRRIKDRGERKCEYNKKKEGGSADILYVSK
jgi:hypothetical protein